MMHWFTKEWWKYLLQTPAEETSWVKAIVCRVQGHPYGITWYNLNTMEPDMHCRNCGDDLG
jgi:hypothetical protein